MPTGHQRQHPELPEFALLYDAGLGFISDGARYTPAEMRGNFVEVFEIPRGHLALPLANGTPAFHNYVAHVLRRFTIDGFHIRQGRGENAWYQVTPAGMEAGQRAIGRDH